MNAKQVNADDRRRAGWRGYLPHFALLTLLLVELGIGVARHDTVAKLTKEVQAGPPRERIAAIFCLTNRGESEAFSPEALRRMLYAHGGLLAEWALTPTMTRNADPLEQQVFLRAIEGTPGAKLCRILLDLQPGKFGAISLEAVETVLQTHP